MAILALLAALLAAPADAAASRRSSLDALLADDAMPYDMSAVEQMERVTMRAQAATKAQVHSQASARTAVRAQASASAAAAASASTAAPLLHDPMSEAEQRFFSESDVDSFLQQHQTMQIKQQAEAKAQAQVRAKAQAEAAAAAKVAAAARAKAEAAAAAQAKIAAAAAAKAQAAAHAQALLDAVTETARITAGVDEPTMPIQVVELEPDEPSVQMVEVDADSAEEAKIAATISIDDPVQPALVEQKSTVRAQGKSKSATAAAASHHSKGSKAWWQSKAGVATNYQHYQRGVHNALIQGGESITTGQHAYSLDLGKAVAQGRINKAKGGGGKGKSGKGKGAKGDKALEQPVPQAAATIVYPTESNPAAAFNPYTGAPFHPLLPAQQYIPPESMPSYMPESKQPWAGAGYYGSGGGQGPHPGSEAFVPLPGVAGKEFGIRAREAWEAHAAQYRNDPSGYHTPANLPPYPYFPAWSRKSEIGGRPDLFPRPFANLAQVTREAQLAGLAAQRHSQLYYPQFNGPVTASAQDLNAVRNLGPIGSVPASLASKYIRAPIGYPAPSPAASRWGPTASEFPQPSNAATFDESVNYAAQDKVPTLGVPVDPRQLGQANVMFNAGPAQGLTPLFGGPATFVVPPQ